jgi:ABC-type phosphonate transport system ATPase subunit
VAGRRPQDCFGTQRNTIDGVNVYVFAGGTIYVRLLIYQVRRCQLIRKYKDKDKERVRYRPTKRMDENSYGKIGARARKVIYDEYGR